MPPGAQAGAPLQGSAWTPQDELLEVDERLSPAEIVVADHEGRCAGDTGRLRGTLVGLDAPTVFFGVERRAKPHQIRPDFLGKRLEIRALQPICAVCRSGRKGTPCASWVARCGLRGEHFESFDDEPIVQHWLCPPKRLSSNRLVVPFGDADEALKCLVARHRVLGVDARRHRLHRLALARQQQSERVLRESPSLRARHASSQALNKLIPSRSKERRFVFHS